MTLRDTNQGTGRTRDGGFTLIEVMVALTLTISGSICLLVNSAQSQFVKAPAASALQQNLRLAMDLMSKDVLEAGDGLAQWGQVFTPNLGGTGVVGSLTGGNSDILEVIANPRSCPPMYVSTAGTDFTNVGNEVDVMTASPAAPVACWGGSMPSLVYVYGPGGTPSPAPIPLAGASPIPGLLYATTNGTPGKQSFANGPGLQALNPGGTLTCPPGGILGNCVTMTLVQLVRYQLAPDPTDNVMSLWRSTQGAL